MGSSQHIPKNTIFTKKKQFFIKKFSHIKPSTLKTMAKKHENTFKFIITRQKKTFLQITFSSHKLFHNYKKYLNYEKKKNTSPLLLKFFLSQFKPEENIFLKSSVTKFLFYKIFFFYKIFSSKTKSKIKKNTKTTQKKFKLKF